MCSFGWRSTKDRVRHELWDMLRMCSVRVRRILNSTVLVRSTSGLFKGLALYLMRAELLLEREICSFCWIRYGASHQLSLSLSGSKNEVLLASAPVGEPEVNIDLTPTVGSK